MIANPEKFHSIILTTNKADNEDLELNIGDKTIKTEQNVKLLGVTIDNKLNFDKHIIDVCRKYRFKNSLPYQAKSVLIQSFIYANFNYCPLIWHFSSSKSLLKVEMIQKRALRFIHNDNNSSYESLLNNAKKSLISVIRLRSLCVEIFKTVNNISPPFMKDIFCENDNGRTVREQNLKNLIVKRKRTVTFGTNSLTVLGPKLWNNLPSHLKL